MKQPIKKGFVWKNVYSDNEKTDEIGRWARVCYYNGFEIAWISGFNSNFENARNASFVECDVFHVHFKFPTNTILQEFIDIDSFDEAKKHVVKMFNKFKKAIV